MPAHPHPGGLRDQLNPDQTNSTLKPGGLSNGDSPGEPFDLPTLTLSCRLARQGSKVFALGYTSFDVTSDTNTLAQRVVGIEQELHFSSGEITRVYPNGRDTLMLPTACFETSARFDPGMSGGPVFDEDGYVCGVVSSGMPHDDGYTSFASATPFIFTLGIKDDDRLTRVYEMAKTGAVLTDQYFQDMRVAERGDGNVDLEFFGEVDEASSDLPGGQ